jgi:hypothetical protein
MVPLIGLVVALRRALVMDSRHQVPIRNPAPYCRAQACNVSH